MSTSWASRTAYWSESTLEISTTLPDNFPPACATNTLSGNPLTMVDAAPASGVAGWKYIGDSTQMLTVGYYQIDTPGTNPARALTMGLIPPAWFPAITTAAGL